MKHARWVSVALALLIAPLAFAEQHPVTLWRVTGDTNSVYLLGSIHLLRQSDYPIPGVIYEVYDDAETLVMELDMDDLDPLAMQSLLRELGMLSDGATLQSTLGDSAYAEVEKMANGLDIPIGMMATVKPWLAAVTIEVMAMSRLGFDPESGIEAHFTTRAVADGKEIIGLENERQQLEMLDSLTPEAQRDLLLQTLSEANRLEQTLDELISAWRHGDIQFMEDSMLDELLAHPELYQSILVDRNRDWVEQLDPLLNMEDDYLVIVGSLHLVGPHGVPSLLSERGLRVEQLRESPGR